MYFFKYCCEYQEHIQTIWLTHSEDVLRQVRSEGYQVYMAHSPLGLFYGFRASWHVVDVSAYDTSPYSSVGAKLLNLWHGYPIKDIRCLMPKARVQNEGILKRTWRWLSNNPNNNARNYLLHQNRKYLWQITESFDVKPENVIIANYPRNIVFEGSDVAAKFISKTAMPWIERLTQLRREGKRVLGYFPTWRGNGADSFLGTRSADDLIQLNQFLAKHDLVIATKWHSCVFNAYQHGGVCNAAEDLNELLSKQSNIIVLGFEQDLNSLLNECDVLISDYSGVIVDYLLSDRPQIFVPYDLDSYKKEWGFVFDYESFIPGPRAVTLDATKDLLADYAVNPIAFTEKDSSARANLRDELFDDRRGSDRIIEFMKSVPS